MSDDIQDSHEKAMLIYKLSEEDKTQIAKMVVTEFMTTMQIGVGKSILDHAWKFLISILIVLGVYGYATTHKLF